MSSKGTMQLTSKIRTFVVVLLLAVSINAATPRPANAMAAAIGMAVCNVAEAYPVVAQVCHSDVAAAIATAIDTVINNVVSAFLTRIDILTGKKLAEGRSLSDQATKAAAEDGINKANTLPSPTRSSCAMDTAVSVAVGGLGGTSTGGTGGGAGGGSGGGPRRRVSLDRSGPGVPRVSAQCTDNPGGCANTVSNAAVAAMTDIQMDPQPPTAGAIERHEQAQALRPCTGSATEVAACNTARTDAGPAAPVPYADIQATTLLGTDTFRGSTLAARDQRLNEALLYCTNLMVPEAPERAGGSLTQDKIIQQATQRGNDARISLGIKVCADMMARRTGITYSTEDPTYQWIIAAACAYRRAFTQYNPLTLFTTASSTLDATVVGSPDQQDALNDALDAACPVPGQPASGANTSNRIYLSKLELLRVISTDMFGTPQFAVATASSNQTELQRMLIAMESVNSQMNMEMLRMQEQLGLIKAAQLAIDVKTK